MPPKTAVQELWCYGDHHVAIRLVADRTVQIHHDFIKRLLRTSAIQRTVLRRPRVPRGDAYSARR